MSKDTFSVFVGPSGNDISYLHKEAINLEKFGPKIVTRASEVEFDGAAQEWFAVLNDGREIARDKSRDVVLQLERDIIEAMKARGEAIPGCGESS
jgi:hypothetical protein